MGVSDRYLCKAKRIDNGKWVEGDLIHEPYGTVIQCCEEEGDHKKRIRAKVDPETLCQHTGLTQKNIWENDIVKNNHGYIGIIRFGQYDITHYGFYIEWINGDEALRIDLLYCLPKIKSIGNIFDNPELLGGDSANGN